MLDIRLIEDEPTGEFDLSISPVGDLDGVDDLSTAILTSLLTDARAEQIQVETPQFRRGWIGNSAPPVANFELGSLLWLIEPGKATQQTMVVAAAQAQQALEWMVSQGIAIDIQVTGEITGPRTGRLSIAITAPDGRTQTQYLDLWKNTVFEPSLLPARFVEEVPFSLESVPGLIVLGDVDQSDHNVAADCTVISVSDIASTADYDQANQANRPLRLRASTGWFYRFDGADDFMATQNIVFPSLVEGTAFFIYKPTANAVAGRRFFALGANGSADNVGGIAFTQQAANVIQVLAAGGTFDVSVTGPSSGDLPVGIAVRWGPAASGADIEISSGVAAADPDYSPNIGQINQLVLGAGFDGTSPDDTQAAGFEMSAFAIYNRQVDDLEVFQMLEYAGTRLFPSPPGGFFDDCHFFDDDFGFAED